MARKIFGRVIVNSAGRDVPVRYIGERHVREDLDRIPSFQDRIAKHDGKGDELFGIRLGMVNPAIANCAVAGMSLSQADVEAAIASTSRQVGAALEIAVAGTVANASHAHGTGFTQATVGHGCLRLRHLAARMAVQYLLAPSKCESSCLLVGKPLARLTLRGLLPA